MTRLLRDGRVFLAHVNRRVEHIRWRRNRVQASRVWQSSHNARLSITDSPRSIGVACLPLEIVQPTRVRGLVKRRRREAPRRVAAVGVVLQGADRLARAARTLRLGEAAWTAALPQRKRLLPCEAPTESALRVIEPRRHRRQKKALRFTDEE